MIEKLNLSKNVQFYRLKKPLSAKSVKDTFKEISKNRSGNYLFREVRKNHSTPTENQIFYSIVSYKIETEPSFLSGTTIKESKYAYLLLIECNDTLALLKKHVDSPEKYFQSFISEFHYDKFCHFHGHKNPKYERITMKNMSISDAVIRSRSFEAKNLNGILSSNSSSRSIPSNFKIKSGQNSYTLTPNTSRVSYRDKKSGIDELIDWVIITKEEIKRANHDSEFLNNFAAPISLKDIIDKNHKVVAILIDLSDIENKVISGVASLKKHNGDQLNRKEINYFFNHIRSPILVDGNTLKTKGVTLSGKISYSKNLITIRNKILDEILVSENGTPDYSIGNYINKNKPFSAVFDSPNYSYYSKSCFEDKHLLNNIKSILNIFNDSHDFSDVLSEKEKPHPPELSRFPETSLFRKIEDIYCENHNIIICDDMNDEWADHIAIDSNSENPSISFIHSKFVNKDTYGASKFHEVVAQALKNIGRTQAEMASFKSKYDSEWCSKYETTNIDRVNNSQNWDDIQNALEKIYQNPNSIKKIVLATPFLKKSKLQLELSKLAQGHNCKPHYIQLIWLINTFISSCKDFGIQAHILCKP